MNTFFAVLTEPLVAFLLSVVLSALLIALYATIASEKWRAYSRFLDWYHTTDVITLLLIVAVIGAIASFFAIISYVSAILENGNPALGLGVYVYGCFAMLLGLFFVKAPFFEKHDIVGLHKQKTKRLEQLIALHLEQLRTHYAFVGKSEFKVQRIISSFEQLTIETAQEKKIRKNKENVYRSLTRLEKLEQSRIQQVGQIEQLQKEIDSMYDTLYQLEATAMEARYENLKKQLHLVKEKLQQDPYAAQIYLKQIQETKQPI